MRSILNIKTNLIIGVESTYKLCKLTGQFSSLGVIPFKNYSPFYNLPSNNKDLTVIRERIAVNIAMYLSVNYLFCNSILRKLHVFPIKPQSLMGLLTFTASILLVELCLLPHLLENNAKVELQEERRTLEIDQRHIKIRAQQNAHIIMSSFRAILYFFIPTLIGIVITAWHFLERFAQYNPDIQSNNSNNCNSLTFPEESLKIFSMNDHRPSITL